MGIKTSAFDTRTIYTLNFENYTDCKNFKIYVN